MSRLVILCAPSGTGKTTVVHALARSGCVPGHACLDTDEVGVSWWDYAGTDHEERFTDDCLAGAVRLAAGQHILFGACISPPDFFTKVTLPPEVEATYYIGMVCRDDELARRLRARPEEAGCGSDAFIDAQCRYADWLRRNRGKFQMFIDNTGLTVDETVRLVADFLRRLDA